MKKFIITDRQTDEGRIAGDQKKSLELNVLESVVKMSKLIQHEFS